MSESISDENSITELQKARGRKTIIQRLGISQIVLGVILIIVGSVYIQYCNKVDSRVDNYNRNLSLTDHPISEYPYYYYAVRYYNIDHVKGIGFGSGFWLIISGILALLAGSQNSSKQKTRAHLSLAIITCASLFGEILIEGIIIHRIDLNGYVEFTVSDLKGCLVALILVELVGFGPLITSAVLCAKLAPSSCCQSYSSSDPGPVMYISQGNSGHGYAPMQSFNVGQAQPGVSMQPQAGVAMQPQAGVAMQPQAGVAMQPQAGVSMQPQAGVSMQPQTGVAMQPQAGFAIQPQAGFAIQPQVMMIQPQGAMLVQQPYGYTINQSGTLQPYNFMMQTQGIQQPQQAQASTSQQNTNNQNVEQSSSALNQE